MCTVIEPTKGWYLFWFYMRDFCAKVGVHNFRQFGVTKERLPIIMRYISEDVLPMVAAQSISLDIIEAYLSELL